MVARQQKEGVDLTVIAGYTNGKRWAIAGDSGTFEGGDYEGDSDSGLVWQTDKPKVWRREESLIGAAGDSSICDLAESCTSGDPYTLAAHMKTGEATGKNWNIIVVTKRSVYYLGEDCSVHKMKRGYMVAGGAGQIALGALVVADKLGLDPEVAVKMAAQASIDNHVYARGPIKTKVLGEVDS